MKRENPKVVKYSNDLSFSPDYSENPFSFCPFDKLRMTKRKRISTALGAKKQTN
jgi:hypothetical protein